jgi:hypothetical protein
MLRASRRLRLGRPAVGWPSKITCPSLRPACLRADATLREAISIAKSAEAARYFDLQPVVVSGDAALDVNDPNEAIAQLKEIGRRRWPSQSEAKQFERAFTDPANAEIAAKAHRRPAATSIFPHPR